MTDRKTRTLAYTKSPKASRRTTFQDELETAVSARSSKKTTALDSDEDDNDFLKDLLKSRKKRIDAIAAMKNMAKMNNFELSDDEGENSRPKRVSFLKTQRVVTSSEDIMASDSHKDEQHLPEPSNSNQNDSSDSQLSQKEHSKSAASDVSAMDPTHSQSPRESLEGSEQRRDSVHEEGSKANSPQPLEMETSSAHISETGGIVERELPTPKPRTRTHALRSQGIVDQTEEDTASPQSRAMTSSVSIPLSSDTASNSASSPRRATSRSSSLPVPERDQADSITSSEARTERSRSLPISTVDSGTKDYHTSDDSKAHEGKYSTSFEEFHENSEEHLDHSISRLSHGPENSSDTRALSLPTKCPRRPQSACSSKVRSKYMGTLKVLDRKVPVEGSQPEADSLRAAIYQEWLQKKKEKLRENMQVKTQEDKLKEEDKKKKEQDKREHAIASYNAWKEKKSETLKAKAKEKLAATIKEQRATEEKEEKKEAAKKMFEKWKQEHDELLKEKYRQQKGAESKCKQKKQHKEEERKKDSNSAFSAWDEKKKNVVMKKMTEERKEHKNKAEEESYLKEEKDKMALEMYEKWLIKKERDQRRQREERKIQAILDDEPPPPWSPPNKTIPFRK